MRVLVCGSRDFTDRELLFDMLTNCWWSGDNFVLIHGCADGADSLADAWANAFDGARMGFDPIAVERYPADWQQHGKAAGPIRNQRMLDEGKPDVVVAFVNKPLEESKGTFDMVRRARAAGVETIVVDVR